MIELEWRILALYLDDVMVFADTVSNHMDQGKGLGPLLEGWLEAEAPQVSTPRVECGFPGPCYRCGRGPH